MPKKVNRSGSNASVVFSDDGANKENAATDVSEELARKTKEVETARKLIETMKLNREKDAGEIVRLNEKETKLVSQIESLESEMTSLKESLETLAQEANGQVASLRQAIDERTTTIELLKDQLSEAKAESVKVKEIQSEKEKQIVSLNARNVESERSLGRAKYELEEKAKQVHLLEEEIARLKRAESEKKREHESGKLENDRKLRTAESKQMQAESMVQELSKKLKQTEESEKQLREEIEGLLHQQTLAIERISQSNASKNASDITCKEAIEKAREANARLAVAEKQLKQAESVTGELRKEIASKLEAIKTLELHSAKAVEAEKQRTQNVAIITSLVVLVVSRLIFA